VIAAQQTFPTGMLGYWVRRLAEGGLVAALTTTSPPRLAHPDGGPKLAGTNPLAMGIPSSDGKPVVGHRARQGEDVGHRDGSVWPCVRNRSLVPRRRERDGHLVHLAIVPVRVGVVVHRFLVDADQIGLGR